MGECTHAMNTLAGQFIVKDFGVDFTSCMVQGLKNALYQLQEGFEEAKGYDKEAASGKGTQSWSWRDVVVVDG